MLSARIAVAGDETGFDISDAMKQIECIQRTHNITGMRSFSARRMHNRDRWTITVTF